MFSMAGIPPLAGFFGKMFVFKAAIDAGLWTLAIVGVLASVVSAFYYLRIVKVMFFDEPAGAFDARTGGVTFVMVASGLFTTLFFLWPAPLVAAAQAAVAALLG
jgi:NADH-quinone oxidoreductase subunit N